MYIEAYGIAVEHRGPMLYSLQLPASGADRRACAVCGAVRRGHQVHTCGRRADPGKGVRPEHSMPGLRQRLRAARCASLLRDHGTSRRCSATLGVLGNKHIPAAYLRASEGQRRELLAGLLDTDGTVVAAAARVQFAVTNQRLADDVYELVVSLGYRCGRTHQASAGPQRGDLDLLHPHLLARPTTCSGSSASSCRTRSARPARPRGSVAGTSSTCGRIDSRCRCAASRSTTTTTSISPAGR